MRVAVGLVLGYLADLMFGDPRRGHPVAGLGTVATRLERRVYRDDRAQGVVFVALLVGATVLIGALLGRRTTTTAAATWVVLGGTSLTRTGDAMAAHLETHDVAAARALLPSLCGRDPSVLDEAGIARAALESIAENTSDATVAPLFWGALGGPAGLLGYRAVNTLDAMIGYRNDRYRNFGWAAARLDDVANLVPARLAGALTVAVAPFVGGSSGNAYDAWRRDAAAHPSPNAGVAEASMAGALGVTLGGTTQYRHGVQERPKLGAGPAPTVADLRRAVKVSRLVQAGAVAVSAVLAVAVGEFLLGRHRDGFRR
ncbi:MAG TPA: cobalamin biosynthesis protein [Aldersonia sp.]